MEDRRVALAKDNLHCSRQGITGLSLQALPKTKSYSQPGMVRSKNLFRT
jgi:hypothetical protein